MDRMTYKSAGVDIDAGDELVRRIGPMAKKTFRPEVLTDLGSFGALFNLDKSRYNDPVLVSGTDGVGTKLKIAFMTGVHDTVGIDLVAMCVNDILTLGAEPLFFLDYFATGRLELNVAESVIKGISDGCKEAGCALIGGETAEMPGFYPDGEYDLAGFAVGAVDRAEIVNGSGISAGDAVIGMPSSGLHSNGYSLARKVLIEKAGMSIDQHVPEFGMTLGQQLLAPTKIYVSACNALKKTAKIKGMAHITGGGVTGNLPRIFQSGISAEIKLGAWPVPQVFSMIQKLGNVPADEMYKTFNMGIGYIIVVEEKESDAAISALNSAGMDAYRIGTITKGDKHGVVYL
ncbi:MAG: phosphoribosylformylglycinamidine cyclo-ligase [Nitrospiraceae bacterium]|nr:phosphoribosylformylglycinamidine cyclo-ligase [Nitrospiraceae bacterium]